jgi:Zn-dependent M28 family amino/carboxypeptidase
VGTDHTLSLFERSEHYPFAMNGIPALWFFTGFHPDYHQQIDTIEKINFPKMAKIVTLVYLTARKVADDPDAPRCVPQGIPGAAHD